MARTRESNKERRRADNLYLSILVDVAIAYQRNLGHGLAAAFLSEHAIPQAVSERVLTSHASLRQTGAENKSANLVGYTKDGP